MNAVDEILLLGDVVTLGEEAVLVSLPGDGVGNALPLVAVAAAPHVVARLGLVTREGFASFGGTDVVRCFISAIAFQICVLFRGSGRYSQRYFWICGVNKNRVMLVLHLSSLT